MNQCVDGMGRPVEAPIWGKPPRIVGDPLYWRQDHPEFDDHPLIEALRPLPEEKLLVGAFGDYPQIGENFLDKPRRVRSDRADVMLGKLRMVLGMHRDVLYRFDLLLRRGYVGEDRNPMVGAEFWRQASERASALPDAMKSGNSSLDDAHVLALIGDSGVGKTTLWKMILEMYPRLILHNHWNGHEFSFQQVPIIRVDCTNLASKKAFCLQFIAALDHVLGHANRLYYRNDALSGRASVDAMLVAMALRALQHGLGGLVVDHLEVLVKLLTKRVDSRAKGSRLRDSAGVDFLDFIVTIANFLQIPVAFTGSADVEDLITARFRSARRLSECYLPWMRIEIASDPNWIELFDTIADYLYTRVPLRDREGISRALHEQSQGILSIAVAMWGQVQRRAILAAKNDSEEEITADLIERVASYDFRLVQPAIQGVRRGIATGACPVTDLWLRRTAGKPTDLPPSASPMPGTGEPRVVTDTAQNVTEQPTADGDKPILTDAPQTLNGAARQSSPKRRRNRPLGDEIKQWVGPSNAPGWLLPENDLAATFLEARRQGESAYAACVRNGFVREWTLDEMEFPA